MSQNQPSNTASCTESTASASLAVDLDAVRRAYSPKADAAEIARNYDYDRARYARHSSTHMINQDPAALSAWLVSAYHGVEKGLTMETAKEGFAARKVRPMIAAIRALEAAGHASHATEGARGSLQSYVHFNDKLGLRIPTEIESQVRSFVAEMGEERYPGGAVSLSRAQIVAATDFDYEAFSQTRCSLRQLTGEPVQPALLEKAVRQALKSPRSCNREMRRVRVAYDPELRDEVLRYHSGNRGFGHRLGALLIISADLREFDMVGERNQGWIDGGIFAMSLVFALHANRLGSCLLNWSVDCKQDQRLREAFDIPDHQVIAHKFAEMSARIDMNQACLDQICYSINAGVMPVAEISKAKVQATKSLEFIASEAMQVFGGAGYMRGNPVERVYREVKIMAIGGGSEEIMRELAVRQMELAAD